MATDEGKVLTGGWKYVFWAVAVIAALSGLASAAASQSTAGMAGGVVGVGIAILIWKYVFTALVGTPRSELDRDTQTPN